MRVLDASAGPVAEHGADDLRSGAGALSRRSFLRFVVTGSTLVVGAPLMVGAARAAYELADPGDVEILRQQPSGSNLLLEITADNRVRFELPLLDMGQGIITAVAMLVADELDAVYDRTDVVTAPGNLDLGYRTAYSLSMRMMWDPVRRIAAEARARLVTAAAEQWDVSADSLQTRDSRVIAPDGRSASYGELSAAAAEIEEPAVSTAPKPVSAYRIVGQPMPRKNAADIATGRQQYTMDIDVPGALYAAIARPPQIGAALSGWDGTEARAMPGVVDIVELAGGEGGVQPGIAVVARSSHEAQSARDRLQLDWGPGTLAGRSDHDLRAELHAVLPPLLPAMPGAGSLDASFEYPYISHAPLETQTAIADVRADRADIWYATQSPAQVMQRVAAVTGIDSDRIRLQVPLCGGAFGRRLHHEAAIEAALISQAVGRPVKLQWTRQDDLRAGRFRPMTQHALRASWVSGQMLSFEHNLAAAWSDLGYALAPGFDPNGPAAFAGVQIPYRFGMQNQKIVEQPLGVPTGSWRATYSGFTAVSNEIFIDEIARAMGEDELEFRLRHLENDRALACLQQAADMAGWSRLRPAGHALGLALLSEYRSTAACVVEIDASDPAAPRPLQAWFAADVGVPINPLGIEAQLQGSLMDAWATMFLAANHVENGAIRESNFDDFQWTRMRNAPLAVDVHLFPAVDGAMPGGSGELGYPPAAAALVNAYARATGTAPRRFPIGENL